MPKLIVTLNQECCRCEGKIQKVLTCLKDEFCIEKVELEKCSKVTITGKFDADKLTGRLQCKAGKFIKTIEKVDDKKDEKKKDEKKEEKKKEPPCKLVPVYPWPYPPCPNPYQVPCGAYPSWQGSCSSCYPQQCQCYYYCQPPPPAPSSPCACAKCRPSCSSDDHHGGGHGYCCGSSCSSKPVKTSAPAPAPAPEPAPKPAPVPAALPYTFPAPLIVCDDNNPSYACSVM